MTRRSISFGVAALAGAALVAGAVAPASADFTPQAKDIVGVGSDTIEFVTNYLADGVVSGGVFIPGYNATAAGGRLVSFNATNPSTGLPHDMVVLKTGTAPVQRPNGSTEGKNALYNVNNPNVDFARSSSANNATQTSAGLWMYPFAVDGLKLAVSNSVTSNAPAAITPAQMVDIYKGVITNWSQIGGTAGVIVPFIPQSGSGTLTFFQSQLDTIAGAPVTINTAVVQNMQEHDPSLIQSNPNAIGPFSTARAASSPTIKLEGGFSAQRAVYNVVRTADLNKAYVGSLFAEDGLLCSTSGRSLIAAAGFKQLKNTLDGGVCGVATQSAPAALVTY